ncbi:enoyl-CoA hydratase/isomerase family protein [Bacillus massilinigeriensis]|uniref:enoyl-CoA hydratase/isomerase family protein n=1 Tax=Bacillus mediterraneensis TaxID=1805474 RepID=UPI0008F87865|nr:enoyl-CoA hydratase/isomerase family protein [Bacillus mediterraneensis]
MPGGQLVFSIERPERRNAVNYAVMDGLKEAIRLSKEPYVTGLVITGSGNAFCSGGDLSIFHGLITADEAKQMLSRMAGILYELMTLTKPTVALLNGTAVGGGCELAAACDFRIAKDGIRAGFIQGRLGITTGWGGGTILLERMQPSKALKMLASAKVYSAKELMEIGFVDVITDGELFQACEEFFTDNDGKEIGVLSAYKQMLVRKWRAASLWERIEEEVGQCSLLWETDAHHEKVAAFLNKR